MIKKLLLSCLVGLSIQSQAENSDKYVVAAGKPTITQSSESTANQLVLSVGTFDPLDEQLDFSKSRIPSVESSKYSIIQFNEGKADSNWLRKNGIKVASYLPNNAFIIVSDNNTNKILTKNKNLRWQGKFLSSYKISSNLWDKNLKKQDQYNLVISIFNDIPKSRLPLLFKKYLPNIEITKILSGDRNELFISVSEKQIAKTVEQLALIDSVHYVDLLLPEKFYNTEAVSAIQANESSGGGASDDNYSPINTPIFDKGLVGSGQIVGVADSGLDTNEDWFVHYDDGDTVTHVVTEAEETTPPDIGTIFPNQKVIGYFIMPGAEAYDHARSNFHGTHVTGSIAADRQDAILSGSVGSISSPTNPGYDNDDGMAPNAQILFQDLGSVNERGEGVLSGQGSSPMWEQAYNAGVRIHSNSYGSESAGEYSFGDIRVDRTLRQFEDMLILFAAGNDGASENSIGSPGVSKSVLTVGALRHGNSSFVANFSNRGPTDDGRMKPDIMATGTEIESVRGNELNNTSIHFPSRTTLSGTSMSTPITAGGSALMRQYYTDGFYPTGVANTLDEHNPTGPLMKATLINGAGVNGGHFDKDVGWGRINLANSLMFDDSDKQLRVWEMVNDNGLKTGESVQFKLGVKTDQNLAITLAWYDLPGPFGSSKTLVNDLDLIVEINGQTYKGNVFSAPATSTTGGGRDSINTVEQVRIPTPVEGIYTITVTGANIPGDETVNSFRQGFGLVATGHFDNIGSTPDNLTNITDLSIISAANDGIQLTWNGGNNADYFEVYRTVGTCANADFKNLRFVGNSETGSYTDSRTTNGIQYAYKIRASQHQGLGDLSTSCAEVVSEQNCDLIPSFSQSSITVIDNVADLCHNKLEWNTATSNCPTSPNIKYNIYRSEDSDFIPSLDNLLTTTIETSYDDIRAPDTAAFYIIRAEDDGINGAGPNGGTETTGTSRIRSQAVGNGFTSSPIFEDVDNISIMNLSFPWQVTSNKAADGILSYKTGEGSANYPADTCSSIVTNLISLSVDDANPKIEYKALYNLEQNWDGVVVEISTDDGQTWTDFPPDSGYPGNFSETTATPVNACGYASTHGAFSGSNNDIFETFTHDLTAFVGEEIKVRWRLSTDPASEFEGFYLDSIQYPNIQIPNACTVNTAPPEPEKPQAGLYLDAGRNGHGFAIEPIANSDLYFTVFYTYKDDGTPEWYTSLSTLENNVLNINSFSDPNDGALNRFIYDFSVDPTGAATPNTLDTSIGTSSLKIDFNQAVTSVAAACNDGLSRGEGTALASWQLGDESGQWCIEPLANIIGQPSADDFGGTWWTGIDDDGWGLSLSFSSQTIIVTIYYFDADGTPRWTQGSQSGFLVGQEITVNMLEFTGFARDAEPTELSNVLAGTVSLILNSKTGTGNDGSLNLNINYQGIEGGEWIRTNIPVTIFTEAH